MSTYNIGFYEDLTKIILHQICTLSLLLLYSLISYHMTQKVYRRIVVLKLRLKREAPRQTNSNLRLCENISVNHNAKKSMEL